MFLAKFLHPFCLSVLLHRKVLFNSSVKDVVQTTFVDIARKIYEANKMTPFLYQKHHKFLGLIK